MTDKNVAKEVVQYSPDKLLAVFARGNMVLWFIVAILLHTVFIGLTSVSYIRDTYIDPDSADKRRKEAALMAQQKETAKAEAAAAKAEAAAPAATEPAKPPAGGTESKATGASDDPEKKLLDEKKDTPIVKAITETAKPSEIPKEPGIGISLEDTNK